MKSLILVFLAMFFLSGCDQEDCCVLPPELSEFNGTWSLTKVINGFAQIEQKGDEIGFTETLIIDAENETFSRQRNNDTPEVSQLKKGMEGGREALILVDEDMYHWYSFEEVDGAYQLVLYQKSMLGAVLADGSDYYYVPQ